MGGCSTVEGREGRSSTAAAQMARWSGNVGGRRGEHAAFIGAARLRGDGSSTSWRGGALAQIVMPATSFKLIISKILYKGAPNVEYESCRSQSHLQLPQRLYGVLLNRFCTKDLPTLNATLLQ
jgi:hypothetical protein